jgi:hypothetical protein
VEEAAKGSEQREWPVALAHLNALPPERIHQGRTVSIERFDLWFTPIRAARAVFDALVAAVGVAGTPEACRERVEAYRRSGIALPIIDPMILGAGRDGKQDVLDTIRACAP